ncbi:MAG: FMN-binding negative transcriptional regulator [Phycisphaerales bacterium JB052]
MTYPPPSRTEPDTAQALRLMREYPFAHLFTAHAGLHSTRIPFLTDTHNQRPTQLRGHLNALNPQAQGLDAAPVLVAFSGPSTYVSPNWRADKSRGGTYDYEEVIVRGTARVVEGIKHFKAMIDDLSSLIEPQFAEVGDDPVWQTTDATPGYIERLVPHITQFVVDIEHCEMISKLHQQFPREDRQSVADHLDRCHRDDARVIAMKIRELP